MFLLVLFFAPKKRTEKDRTFFCAKNNAINSLIIDLNITNGCKVDVGVMERRYVNDDIVPWRDENGILTIGLLDFLMNPDSLNN